MPELVNIKDWRSVLVRMLLGRGLGCLQGGGGGARCWVRVRGGWRDWIGLGGGGGGVGNELIGGRCRDGRAGGRWIERMGGIRGRGESRGKGR